MVTSINSFLHFALPDIGEAEISAVVESLRSGWMTTGPSSKQLETIFADRFGGEAVGVNSCTAGMHLALEALGVGPGDEVITTPYTFTATAEVVRYLGADPVFVDIDTETFNIDPRLIEKAITKKTKAIMPVHFGGLACDMDAILRIARSHGLKVVEDAAHALPTTYKGRDVGSLESDATVFSFYATKTLATGEGGMVVARDSEVAGRCRTMRLHGMDRDAFNRYRSTRPAWQYDIIAPGFKYNMPDILASIGLVQYSRLGEMHAKRSQLAERYNRELFGLPIQFPPQAPLGDIHAWHLYEIRLKDDAGISRDAFIDQMSERGIGTSVHFISLHLMSYWSKTYGLTPDSYPNAALASGAAVSLPIYSKMTDDDQTRIIEAIHSILS